MFVTQDDLNQGAEFYCLCHGWRRLTTLDDVCPRTYASRDTARLSKRKD